MASILVVEDEAVMAAALEKGLRRHGHTVEVVGDGRAALAQAEQFPYDVILLDRDLPVVHGDLVCEELASSGHPARILMLTAAREIDERVKGLRLGADDYLAKPFGFEELLARIEALTRRPAQRAGAPIVVGDLELDPARRTVRRAGTRIELTNKEFGVLLELARDPGTLLSSERLLELVWDANADPFTNAVRVTMVGLRKKLGEPPLIDTVRGVGYRLAEAP